LLLAPPLLDPNEKSHNEASEAVALGAKSKLKVDLKGLLAHGCVALVATLLDLALPATLLYIAYQLLDYLSGEDAGEVKGDLVEWLLGLVLGGLIRLVLREIC
jgi:hypothetical protein